MKIGETVTLNRACDVIEIPSGIHGSLPQGSPVRIMQSLGNSYTVVSDHGYGNMYRIDAQDADALGLSPAQPDIPHAPAAQEGTFSEPMVWVQLKTVFDP